MLCSRSLFIYFMCSSSGFNKFLKNTPLLSCSVVSYYLWTVAVQAPLSMGFPRQEYWSGLPLPTPGDFPDPRIELMSLVSPVLAGGFYNTLPPEKPQMHLLHMSSLELENKSYVLFLII